MTTSDPQPRTGEPAGGTDAAGAISPPRGGRRRRFLVTAVVGAVLGVALGQLYLVTAAEPDAQGEPQQSELSEAGQPVTEFAVDDRGDPLDVGGTTLTGSALSLSDLRGDVVVVNVWGSWCPPCREEAPVLAKLSRRYAEQGVSFVGVNVRDNRAAALAFEENYGITYPSIEDRTGSTVLALNQYIPVNAVPVTLVLDRQGRVAARVLGAVREATLRALLAMVLGERARDTGIGDT